MKIGLDLRLLTLGVSGGIAQLSKNVLEHAIRMHPEHEFLVFCTPFNRSLLQADAANARFFTFPAPEFYRELDKVASKEALSVLFRTYPKEEPLRFPAARQIFLIPDIQHEVYPEFFDEASLSARRLAFQHALGSAGAIATISNFARDSLVSFPQTKCGDIFLMEPAPSLPLGVDGPPLSDDEKALVPPRPFFLFPANLWKHKNHPRLLAAFRLFRERSGKDVSLVLTGHPEGWDELSGQCRDLPVSHLGFVRPELLRLLLERAHALAFFSLYEGFGMPLIEAFEAGTPVICGNTTSLPEIGGDAVLSCDPTDVEAIAGLMDRICTDHQLRDELVARGKARVKSYSWSKSASALIEACERVHARALRPAAAFRSDDSSLPLVSIVTPSYNQGRFLRRTIDSVLAQTYPRIEYLVVDGGSSDDSVDILRSFGDRFAWTSEPDRGQTHAVNKGMSRVSGDILAYLNSDDVLFPGAIDRVVRYFREYPDCDAVYGDADHIDEDDGFIDHYPTAEFSFDRLVENCMISQPAMFWRRRLAEKVGPFDEQLNYTMDYDYWFRMALAGGTIRFLPERLAGSRLHPATKTLSARTKVYGEIFKTSRKHAGRVHKRYVDGYWHHLILERDGLASRLARKVPGLLQELAWFHYYWYHRRNYSWKEAVLFTVTDLPRRWIAFAIRSLPLPARFRAGAPPPAGPRVAGFWSDNWLSPSVRIRSRSSPVGGSAYIAGTAPIAMEMRISAGPALLGSFHFEAHQYRRIDLPAGRIGDQPIEIQSSAYMIDHGGRRLSFLLQDTNLFTEQDLA